jgi:hypothetical protein
MSPWVGASVGLAVAVWMRSTLLVIVVMVAFAAAASLVVLPQLSHHDLVGVYPAVQQVRPPKTSPGIF